MVTLAAALGGLCRAQESFDLNEWMADRGLRKDLKEWNAENPNPWRSYFNPDSEECAARWFVNLGPLGVRTRMHDRSWGVFAGCRGVFPKALADEHGLVWNAFEVLGVKKGSPAEGKLLPGDLILGMDDHELMTATHVGFGEHLANRTKRGLEMHAGVLIDAAEERGSMSLNVLRLPEEEKGIPLATSRSWKAVETLSLKAGEEAPLRLKLDHASLCRIRKDGKAGKVATDGLFFCDPAEDERIPVEIASKRGAGSLIGDPLEVPAGEWWLEGKLTANRNCTVTIETVVTPALPESLQQHLRTVTLDLDPIGSFGHQFDPEGEKARHYAAMLAHRLAVQQGEDGSWKAGGYASLAFHTSACGLALLSTGDPAYDEAIRKAAYYVANHGEHDKWSYSNGMWLVFLSEYYLHTRDEEILPAMRMQVRNLRRFVLSDYTAGHSFMKPGYGGSGWIGGGGVISLALALASHTPAMESDDLALLDRMLERAQELAPHGRIPYGRSGKIKSHDAQPGQGGSCATGPYFIASLIRGGADLFTNNCLKRYSTPPFGSAEDGHATQTLHFVFACLAAANCSPEAHRAHMDAYLWKFTTLREFDGFINKNNYRTEYHNGDGVIGEPYWRTAGYLLVMNAHKRNLGITGKPEYRGKIREVPVVYHRDRAAHNQVKRNWALVEAVLGDKVPPSFGRAFDKLQALEVGPDLGTDLRALLVEEAPMAAREIMALTTDPASITRAQLAQFILGHGFQASFSPSPELEIENQAGAGNEPLSKKEMGSLIKELEKKIAKGQVDSILHTLTVLPLSMIQKDSEALPGNMELAGALFPVENLTIEVADPDHAIFEENLKLKATTAGGSLVATRPFEFGKRARLMVRVSYQSAGLNLAYAAPLVVPAPEARQYAPFLTQLPVEGTVIEDYGDSYSMRVLLDSGAVLSCEQRNTPAPYLLAGARYRFHISANNGGWGHDLRRVEALNPGFRIVPGVQFSTNVESADLNDLDLTTGIDMTGGGQVTCSLDSPVQVASTVVRFLPGESKVPHTIEAFVDGKWTLMRNSSTPGLLPVVPATTSKVRVTFPENTKGHLSEFQLVTPSKAVMGQPRFSW